MSKRPIFVILAFFGSVAALLCFELILRITLPEPENLTKLKSSNLFLYENKPGATLPSVREGEFNNIISINSYGFRDDEFEVFKEPEVFRIAVLGDSQEEAMQVELDRTWQKVMARKLTAELKRKAFGKLRPRVEAYNFGVNGYGTDQEWLILREKVWQFSPDMVILAFSPNDVGDTYKNKLVRIEDGRPRVVSPKESAGGNFLGRAGRETYTYHLIAKVASASPFTKSVFDKVRTGILGFAREERFFLSDAQLATGPFEVVASQTSPPVEVVKTWQVVKVLIADMKRQADENSAEFLITVNIPRAQVRESDWIYLLDLYKLDPATSSPYEINEVLSGIAGDLGINFYDPRFDAIEWRERKGDLHFEEDAHFNVNGHEFMGTKVAEYIEEKGLISN